MLYCLGNNDKKKMSVRLQYMGSHHHRTNYIAHASTVYHFLCFSTYRLLSFNEREIQRIKHRIFKIQIHMENIIVNRENINSFSFSLTHILC